MKIDSLNIQTDNREIGKSDYLLKVIDALPHSIVVIGTDYLVKLVNSATRNSHSYNEFNSSRPYCYQLMHNRDTPCDDIDHPCPLKEIQATHKPVSLVHKHFGRDGEPQTIELEASPIFDLNDNVIGIVESLKDVTNWVEKTNRQKRKVAKLSVLAHHDPLTSLPNRLLFMDRLKHALAKASRYNNILAVLFIDLDAFKQINDQFGHRAGDKLLCNVASLFMGCLRESDTLARLGGDEFIVLLDQIETKEGVLKVVRKIFNRFSSPFVIEGQDVFMTCSIGISLYPLDGLAADGLINHADIAMYRAKSVHNNSYEIFSQIETKDEDEDSAPTIMVGSIFSR